MFFPVEFVELKDPHSMELLLEAWQALAAEAAEPNPFYEPWALLPAFEYLGDRSAPSILFVWRDSAKSDLVGVFPLAHGFGYHHLPISYRGLWQHLHCFLTTPLVKRGSEADGWHGLLEWASRRATLLNLGGFAVDGSVYDGLIGALRDDGRSFELESKIFRPLLAPSVSAEEYLGVALRKKRHRQFNRKREMLGEHGVVHFEVAEDSETLTRWTSDFIELEARGWKGRGHTAIKGRENEQVFFQALVRRGAGRGKVRAYRLTVGDVPIAMRFDLVSNGAGFALKIAYDEEYARFSPGGLLEIEILQRFFERGDLRFVDSCTIPSPHSIHGYFWRESRAIGSITVGAPTLAGATLMSFGRWVRAVRGSRADVRPGAPDIEAAPS